MGDSVMEGSLNWKMVFLSFSRDFDAGGAVFGHVKIVFGVTSP